VPTYDYRCRQCGTTYEVIHSMLENGPTTCEKCGGELRRVLHPAGIIFKGSGFYKTDARSASTSKPASSGSSAGSPTPSGTDGGASSGTKTDGAKGDGGTHDSAPAKGASGSSEGGTKAD
jgi:putative FmdB family regulatory protein